MTTLRKLNRLCKFRTIYAGWQLGTRPKGDPESDAVRDHHEVTLLLRAEVSALAGLLIAKGIFTQPEFEAQLGIEADALTAMLEAKFPGVTAHDDGLGLDPAKIGWMRQWRP